MLKSRWLVLVLWVFMGVTSAWAQQNTFAVKDMRGQMVQVPRKLDRIATISDGFVESVMTHLGEQRKIVAIGSWSMKRDYKYNFETAKGEKYGYTKGWNTMKYLNPWLDELPIFNSPQGNIISYETLAKANPQLVIMRVGDCTVRAANQEVMQKTISTIESLGIPLLVLHAPSTDLSSMRQEMAILGRLFGKEKEALALSDYLSSTVDLIKKRTQSIPQNQKSSVLMLGLNPNVRKNGGTGSVWGIDTPESHIIENIVNARNAFRDKGTGKVLNVEQIYALDPDVIVLPTSNGFHPPREILEGGDFALLSELRAIKSRRVVAMPWTPMNCARRVEYPLDMLVIAKAAYPDRFKDVKVHQEALKLYKHVYRVNEQTAKGLRSSQWLDWTLENDF